MNYHDRRSIKWSSLMLPEHKERLSAWYKEQDYETQPELDEQQHEEIGRILGEALQENQGIEVTYFRDHHFHKVAGRIGRSTPTGDAIQIVGESGGGLWIEMKDITDVD